MDVIDGIHILYGKQHFQNVSYSQHLGIEYEIDKANLRKCCHFAPANFHGADVFPLGIRYMYG